MQMIPGEVISNTLVDYPRLWKLLEFLEETKHLPGIIAEVGVYKGGTALLIAQNTDKTLVLFDTFEGMPKVSDKDLHKEKDFNDTSYEHVANLLDGKDIEIFQGVFPENSQFIDDQTFSLVHLDCDIYQSVKDSLEFFYPRMDDGGIIVLDDYNEPDCPGAKLAIDEFLSDKPEKIFSECQSQVAIKRKYGN